MENNELNNVAEELVENTANAAEEVVKESFADKHPYLATMGTGVILGTGLYAGAVLVKGAVKGAQFLYGKIRDGIAAKKEAKAQKKAVENSDEE